MARINNSITFGSAFNISAQGPIDSRMRVEFESDLTSGSTWPADTAPLFNGLTVTVVETGDIWVLMDKDNFQNISAWKKTGNSEVLLSFRKKVEGREESTLLTIAKVTDNNALLTYPELKDTEYVDGGYWDTDITTLRNIASGTTVYYVTPFMTEINNRILLKICFNNGWSSSPDHLTLTEAQSITDEMVAEASKRLALIEDEQGNLIEVFDSITFEDEGENPIIMTNYNLYEGLCYDKYGNEYNISDCYCYSKDGVRYSLGDVKYGNCFYELESWTELPYFTGITKLSDGETYRVFLDYSHIQDINLENITSLLAYALFRCVHLRNLYIPSGMADIETYAIASCDGLQSLVVDENNPKYTSKNSEGVECNCIVEKPATRGTRSAINNELTLIQGCNVSILPDNIKHIASGAFDECTRLTGITLPDGLVTVGDNVFRGCTALEGDIIVPNTVESIGDYSFKGCSSLQGVNINVPVISQQLFKDCSSLSSVTLGSGVTEIGNQAFMNDSSLTAITIPDSVTVAGTSSFANCDLRSVNTNNIETISINMFANNIHLSSITMTDSTVNIGDNAFEGANISAITIPQNVRSLSNTAFDGCNLLKHVIWDVNDTELSGYAGKFVTNAETINNFEFGEHCTVIPDNLCANLVNIDTLYIPNTILNIGNGAFYNCDGLTSIVVPDNVNGIGALTFGHCNNLETVTIGSGVTMISLLCFVRCISLETVDLSNNPNKINLQNINAFSNCDNLSLIIAPDDLIAEYRESQDWYEYREIIFGKSVYTITFDSLSGETTPETQLVRCGAYIENPGRVHKDLYEFEYWEDENGYVWDFDEDYAVGDMTLYAHYREVKAIMVKSISTGVTDISMSYNGSYPANVEYSFDGLNWYNIWNISGLAISTSEGYNHYVYFRGYNPDGFSRDATNYTWFNINNGQCDLLGNIMYLKNYNEELDYVNSFEFYNLFQYCNAIRNCDKLTLFTSATTLAESCYSDMFSNCTSLSDAPELPATTLASGCYNGMFLSCTSLTMAHALPATALADWCYSYMFEGCTSLTKAPELHATILASGCYYSMFYNCTSLTEAPELPATTLAISCYGLMFYGCTNLNYIKCLAVSGINQNYSTYRWVRGVANSGTFVKNPSAMSWPTGDVNGIPSGWDVEDAQ